VSRRVACVLALLLAAVTACSSSSSGSHASTGTFDKTTAHYRTLVKQADLSPCPTSSAAPAAASGGLPKLTLECLGNGPSVHLAGLSGKPEVVNVWASWCGPCQLEAPYLSKAYAADRSKVGFLGIDSADTWDSALNFEAVGVKPHAPYPSVYDEDHKAMNALHQAGPPLTAFVAASGQVVHIERGQITSLAELQRDIATYLHVAT
jgi:thiol-disulfide isomerase/thioredoxin